MSYTFIIVVYVILERVLQKNGHWNGLGDVGAASFILGCPLWMSDKAEMGAEGWELASQLNIKLDREFWVDQGSV